jgi:hypothetical protein
VKLGRRAAAIESFDRAVEILRGHPDSEVSRTTLEGAIAERATLLAEGDG